jgi:membrane fusion protein (multidrug efflux system)
VLAITPTNVPIYEQWIGTLEGYVNAQIRAQVSGYLVAQDYLEGSEVKKGSLLFEIDPRPFQAVVNQSKARLGQDQAQLEKTRLDVERYKPLTENKAISRQDLDNAIQANLAAQAQIKADQAAIEAVELNLSFTRITAPIDGLAGVAQAQIGDLVSPQGGALTTISTIDPIRVYFQVSEQSYLAFWRPEAGSTENTNLQSLPLELILSDGSIYPERGKFFFADRQINQNTGTMQIAGLFPNPKRLLRPGQYAQVRAQTRVRTNALIVPQRAVTELQGAYQVAVVDASNKASLRPVKAGEQVGASWIIEQGIKPGERIVVEGLQKVKEGETVAPKEWK